MAKKTTKIVKVVTRRSRLRATGKKDNVPKTKKITRTRSIERTIQEGEQYESFRRNKDLKKSLLERRISARNNLKARVPSKKAKVARKSTIPSRPAIPSAPAVLAGAPPATAPRIAGSSSLFGASSSVPPTSSSAPVVYSQSKRNAGTVLKAKDNKARPLPAFGVIEVCFCIDATGSMSGPLAQAKSTVVSLISKIEEKVHSEGIELRFAVVTYRDHPPQDSTYVTRIQDFTNDKEIRDYINKLDAFGGGDQPEAAHDGLLASANDLSWTNTSKVPTVRYVFHIADAPAHGGEFDTGESQKGCTCGISTDAVIHAINVKEIHYRLIKVTHNAKLDKMGKHFQKLMTNYEETTIQKANELDVRVSDMVMRELLPDA